MATNKEPNFFEGVDFGPSLLSPADQAANDRAAAESSATARLIQQRQAALDAQPHTQILPEPADRAQIEGRILGNDEDYAITQQDHFRAHADADRNYLALVDTANSRHVDNFGNTPLAQLCGDFEASDLRDQAIGNLLAAGADPWATNAYGRTALHEADAPAAALLIQSVPEERRAEYVNLPDCNNVRALHRAANEGDANKAQTLLDAGAEASLVNRKGETAEHVAQGGAKDVLIADRVIKERGLCRQAAGVDENEEPVRRSRSM